MNRTALLIRRVGVAIVALVMVAPYVTSASTGMIGTDQVIRAEQTRLDRAVLLAALDRDEVLGQLVALGVDPADARNRIMRLTDDEIAALNERMKELPAGGNAWAAVGIIFIILVITDALGFTDVFTFVRSR